VTRDIVADLAAKFGWSREDMLELLRERAAIRQYDGGMSREDADRAAIGDVRALVP
jgi:hypothetical protein